jgi:hypothetical protein
MKHIRPIFESEPSEPKKDRELAEKDKLFHTIGFYGWVALLYKGSNTKDLWVLSLETPEVEGAINEYTYMVTYGSKDQYDEPDFESYEDLATDIISWPHRYYSPPKSGEGLKDWEDEISLVKVDEDLAVMLLEEFLPMAYKTSNSNSLATARSKSESMRIHKIMVDALVRAFPGAPDRI